MLMVENLKTIDSRKFDMSTYNSKLAKSLSFTVESFIVSNFECASAGCVIGHSVRLDPELMKKVIEDVGPIRGLPRLYTEWSERFTGLQNDTDEWQWCFGGNWIEFDNTISGAISRIEALVDGTWKNHDDYDEFVERQES